MVTLLSLTGGKEMENSAQVKIWRYMDLAKFLSLLSNEALYFACPSELDDPYEGFYPKSLTLALSHFPQQYLDQSPFGVLDLSGRATGGAFHPTAEGHAMIANDATVELCQRIGCGP